MTLQLEQAFDREWGAAGNALRQGDLPLAFHHYERAHVLGQRRTRLHLRSHFGLLRVGWRRRDLREVAGQLSRIIAAALFSRIWVPVGNTGGANVSAFRPMDVPADLQALLARDQARPTIAGTGRSRPG